MPGVLSTIKNDVYGRVWSFPYNCYEIGHGWTPSCTDAALGVGYAAFMNSLPLYSSLYLFTQLALQKNYTPKAFLETFKSTITSASFLGFNFFGGIGVSCIVRNQTDRYYYRLQCLLPGFVASYMALLIERPSRRPALAFYLANMSTELIYKSLESKGYVKSVKHGETILFVLGMACWLRFVRIYGFGHDPVSTALKYLIGPMEAKSRSKKILTNTEESSELLLIEQESSSSSSLAPKKLAKNSRLEIMSENVTNFLNIFFGAHETCPHKGISCVDYSLTPTITRFSMAYIVKSLMNLARGYRKLMKTPGTAFKDAFVNRSSFNIGMFLATFVLGSKGMHCILRRATGQQEVWHSAVAGGVSGLSMLWAPKSTLSTYIIWKCLEQYFFLGVQNKYITNPDITICLVYAVSVNVLLYIFALEPRFIRPSYMKFIDKISDHKLHRVNRLILDVFGTGSSVGYEDFFPDLDPQHMSKGFQELVFNWLIQPYE